MLNTADPFYPPVKVCDVGVNTGIIRFSTFVSPAHNSIEDAIGDEWPTRITLARILSALRIASANHSVGDAVSVTFLTRRSVHDWKRHFH